MNAARAALVRALIHITTIRHVTSTHRRSGWRVQTATGCNQRRVRDLLFHGYDEWTIEASQQARCDIPVSSGIWQIHVFLGRPGSLFQLVPGFRPVEIFVCSHKAWCAGTAASSRAIWPNSDVSLLWIRFLWVTPVLFVWVVAGRGRSERASRAVEGVRRNVFCCYCAVDVVTVTSTTHGIYYTVWNYIDIGHKPYRPQRYRPHRRPYPPHAKSISATGRYRPHDIGHRRLVNVPLLLFV